MTKAERRKRARQRAKEGQRQTVSQPIVHIEQPAVEPLSSPPIAPVITITAATPTAPTARESDFITGPIVAHTSTPAPRSSTVHLELPGLIDAPIDHEFEDAEVDEADEDADEEDDDDDDDDDTDEDGDDEDDDIAANGEDDEDEDDEDADEEEALFNAACGAVEQGDAFSWNELIGYLCTAEVTDPRLGLLVALLVEQGADGQPLKLTGARVLKVLTDLQLDDLVVEAREVATLATNETGNSPEERDLVRHDARALNAQAAADLEGKAKGKTKPARPIRSSDVRARQSALGTAVPVSPAPAATRRSHR